MNTDFLRFTACDIIIVIISIDDYYGRSEFSIIHNEVEKKQSMITENRKSFELCTGNVAARIFGLELCGELKYPNATTVSTGPYYPLTGPTSLSLFLYKRDTHSGYTLLAKKVEVSNDLANVRKMYKLDLISYLNCNRLTV